MPYTHSQNIRGLERQKKEEYLPVFLEIAARHGHADLIGDDGDSVYIKPEDGDTEFDVLIFDSDQQEHSFFYDINTSYGAMVHEVVLKMIEINDSDPDPYQISIVIDEDDPLFRHDIYDADGGEKWVITQQYKK